VLINKRNRKIIAKEIIECKSFFSKLRGLMFRRKFPCDGLIFYLDEETVAGASLHMLFVFFPMDVLWLDSEWRVVDLREGVAPFTPFIAPKKAAKYVVELPEGKIVGSRTKVGDKVILK